MNRYTSDAHSYGVTRVYLQQCGYVQSDAQNAHNSMLMLLRTVENHALDPNAGKAR
jgi:meiotic recombination protein REC8